MENKKREAYIRHCIDTMFCESTLKVNIGYIGMWLNRASHSISVELSADLATNFADTHDTALLEILKEYFKVSGQHVYCVFRAEIPFAELTTVLNRKMTIDYLLENE